jgi:hypothetical protein
MTKSDLWAEISKKNPGFNSEGNVTLSAKGLRKMFDLAYGKGFDQGKAVSAALNDLAKSANGFDAGGMNEMNAFKDIFGGLGK